jgi:hypothetical protein
MEHKERAKGDWELTRVRGRTRFVLTRGVLGWGVPMTLFMLLKDYFFDGEALTPGVFLIGVVVFLSGGYFFGLVLWILNEKSYRR